MQRNDYPSGLGIIRQFQEDRAVLEKVVEDMGFLQNLALEYNMSEASADELGALECMSELFDVNERILRELKEVLMRREMLGRCLGEILK
jgi:hypothetical protein